MIGNVFVLLAQPGYLWKMNLVPYKCRICWWQECGQCYNKKFAMITHCRSSQAGEDIDEETVGVCKRKNGFTPKRSGPLAQPGRAGNS